MDIGQRSIEMHRRLRGKFAIRSKAPLRDLDDLSLAYTPGVGQVSLEVAANKELMYELTSKWNMVAVVSDGSAVLGLGNIGPEGAMPVMEGKAILFKELADIDAVPICLATQDSQEIIKTVKYLAPTFGGFNLEDISAPRCFEIEEALQDIGIPVFHDDQWGTSIVVLAAITNALKVVEKRLDQTKIVFSGAGASGIACTRILLGAGAKNVILVDTKGAINRKRTDLTKVKREVAQITNPNDESGRTQDVLKGADVFIGLSGPNLLTAADVRKMAPDAVVLAMANPVPEIMPDEAKKGGAAVVGTGRSDLPNQINNVLAFPGVFRGALDIRAPRVTMEMKVAAAHALAGMVKEPKVERIIPSPLDRSVVPVVSNAVKEAWKKQGQKVAK